MQTAGTDKNELLSEPVFWCPTDMAKKGNAGAAVAYEQRCQRNWKREARTRIGLLFTKHTKHHIIIRYRACTSGEGVNIGDKKKRP